MDKPSMSELQALVNKQKDQLVRYENRLRDLLTAYKGLLKEKEALEATLSSLNNVPNVNDSGDNFKKDNTKESQKYGVENENKDGKKVKQLELQLATVMNSLATLSAEKSRMEASFQADKKQLRLERDSKDKTIRELRDSLKKAQQQNSTELETMKSKLIIERHDREKEQNDHGVMIRELQKLLSEERRLKEQLEMQISDLGSKLNHAKANSSSNMEHKVKESQNESISVKHVTKQVEKEAKDTGLFLSEMQNEITKMKIQHAEALEQEKERARQAEENARSLATLHEERVANLETRLAELSDTVGAYDRLRQTDLTNIQKLKDEIALLCKYQNAPASSNETELTESDDYMHLGVHNILAKIVKLKKILLTENERLEKPIDLSSIFTYGLDHSKCKDEYNKLMQEYYEYKSKTKNAMSNNISMEVQDLKSHIKSLQDEIIILNSQLDKNETMYNASLEQQTQNLTSQKSYYKNLIADMEAEFKEHINQLEKQLQKQRDRSMNLLEEKEQEIKTLKESFEVFLPGNSSMYVEKSKQKQDEQHNHGLSQLNSVLQGGPSVASGESPHMLHYAHELARKDVDISVLRRTLRELDDKYRDVTRQKTLLQESWNEKELTLQERINRLERCMSREGANLEYLKNVVMSYILSTDTSGRGKMLNAIAAVLKFSPEEIERINKHNTVKLYSNTSTCNN